MSDSAENWTFDEWSVLYQLNPTEYLLCLQFLVQMKIAKMLPMPNPTTQHNKEMSK